MRFTAQEEYGLRCLLQMARHEGEGSMTIAEIAKAEGLTQAYVAKLMGALRHAGLVLSHRGQTGGYRLARPAGQLSLGESLSALGGDLYTDAHCGRFTGTEAACVHSIDCSIRSLLMGLQGLVEQVLRRTTLKDLISSERAMGEWVHAHVDAGLPAPATVGGGCGCHGGEGGCGGHAQTIEISREPLAEERP